MDASENLERELPYLRRYARAVTGNGQRGDALVEDTVLSLLDDDNGECERIGLFTKLDERCGRLAPQHYADDIAVLSSDARRALLLTAMEGFSLFDAAAIMRMNEDQVASLVADAETGLTASLATDVFIIEDEPLVAAHIAQITTQMGHTVCGQAATRDAAVEDCLAKSPGLLLADIQLADGSSGADAAAEILGTLNIPVIFITAYPQRMLTGHRSDPAFLIPKPFRPDMVKAVISQALIRQTVGLRSKK